MNYIENNKINLDNYGNILNNDIYQRPSGNTILADNKIRNSHGTETGKSVIDGMVYNQNGVNTGVCVNGPGYTRDVEAEVYNSIQNTLITPQSAGIQIVRSNMKKY